MSVGTVSRVLNDHPSVTAARRERVQQVIAELGYRPDPLAQSMRRKSIRAIGVVIPDIRNPFFAELMQGIENEAKSLGYSVFFVSSDEDAEAEKEHVAELVRRKVDGVILLPSVAAKEVPSVPGASIVVVDRPVAGAPVISADHRAGSKIAVDFLLSLGHRRIAFIAGPQQSATASARLTGFVEAMAPVFAADDLKLEDYIAYGEFDYASGRTAAAELLGRRSPPPTAIFASSDQQAIGALRLAADRGMVAPRDVSIVGFDDIPLADLVTPRLTTIVQPVGRIARAAVSAVLESGPTESILFPCELARRDSAGPPPMFAFDRASPENVGRTKVRSK